MRPFSVAVRLCALALLILVVPTCGGDEAGEDTCVSSDECAEGLSCVRGLCLAGCNETRDCGFGEICVGNECVEESVGEQNEAGYAWQTTGFGACDTTCGEGERTRSVRCIDLDDGAEVDGSNCDDPAPSEVENCVSDEECTWVASGWSDCSVTCGSTVGVETRVVQCEDLDGNAVDDTRCENKGAEPVASRSCTPTEACTWTTGDWGPCSVTCGEGVQTRAVNCTDGNGGRVADSQCEAASRPAVTQTCTPGACDWVVGAFGDCSATCGSGTRSRTVECRDGDGNVVPDASCPTPKPGASAVCNVDCNWETGLWGPCSVTCAFETGTQTRSVTCEDEFGNVVDSSNCGDLQPATQQSCNGPGPTVDWASNCGPCGFDGIACTRDCLVSCPDTTNGCCDPAARPPDVQPCTGCSTCLDPPCPIPVP